jgi:hypothetical protein
MSRQHIVKDAFNTVGSRLTGAVRFVILAVLLPTDGEVHEVISADARVALPSLKRFQKILVSKPETREKESAG